MAHTDETIIREHSADLGALKADVSTLKEGQSVLFRKVDSLETTVAKLVEGIGTLKAAAYALLGVSLLAFITAMFKYVITLLT